MASLDQKLFSEFSEQHKFPADILMGIKAGLIVNPIHLSAVNKIIAVKTNFSTYSVIEQLEIEASVGKKIKEDFLRQYSTPNNQNQLENPALIYPKLNLKKIETVKHSLRQFTARKDKIIKDLPYSDKEKRAINLIYQAKIRSIRQSIDLLTNSYYLAKTANSDLKKYHSQQIKELSETIYSQPQPEQFDYFYSVFLAEIKKYANDPDPEIKNRYNQLLSKLKYQPDADNVKKYQNLLPNENPENITNQTLKSLQEIIIYEKKRQTAISYIDDYFQNKDKKTISSAEIQAVFQNILSQLGLNNWQVVKRNDDNASICTNQENKQIKIPTGKFYTKERTIQLFLHEISVHIVRRENGEKSALEISALGFEDFDDFEEGWTSLHEKLSDPQKTIANLTYSKPYYLGLGLIYGFDQQNPRDFKDLFSIMSDYFFLPAKTKQNNIKKKILISEISEAEKNTKLTKLTNSKNIANNNAYNFCKRLFRGTTGDIPGVCLTKDIIYEAGLINVLNLLNEHVQDYCQNDYSPEKIKSAVTNFYNITMFGKINLNQPTKTLFRILKII